MTRSSPHRWRVLALLFALSIVTYLDRINLSVAGRPMSEEFGLSDLQFGAIFSAFIFGYALFQVPGGWLGDRLGYTRTIVTALFCWSAFTLLMPWAGSGWLAAAAGAVPALWTVRFLIGVGEAAAYPCATALIGRWFPATERGLATGIFFAGVGVGSTLTPPLIAWLMVTFSWEISFYVCGAIGFALCIVLALGVRDRPPDGDDLTRPGIGAPPAVRPPTPWRRLLADRHVILLTASYACYGYVGYVYFAWFYRYLVDGRGIELLSGSVLSMFPFFAMAVGSVAGGWLSDRSVARLGALEARRRTATFGLLPGLPLVAIGSTTSSDVVAVACLSLAFGLMSLSLSSYWSTVGQIVPSHAGTAAAIMNTGLNLAGATAPMLTPVIKDSYGWSAAWMTAGAAATMAGLLWTFIRVPAPEAGVAVEARSSVG